MRNIWVSNDLNATVCLMESKNEQSAVEKRILFYPAWDIYPALLIKKSF